MSTHHFNNNSDQAERKQVIKDCYQTRAQAQADADMAAGGRFKKQTETLITGVGVPQYPRQPSNSPWHSDPVPPEEPLGYSIDALPELGGASPASLPCAGMSATPDGGGELASSSPPQPPSEE